MRIHINALLRIHIIVSQTVQGHCPDRICILVHCAQPIRIIFMITHYNGFFTSTLKTDSEHWTQSLKTESEKNSPLKPLCTFKCFSSLCLSLNIFSFGIVISWTRTMHPNTHINLNFTWLWWTRTLVHCTCESFCKEIDLHNSFLFPNWGRLGDYKILGFSANGTLSVSIRN